MVIRYYYLRVLVVTSDKHTVVGLCVCVCIHMYVWPLIHIWKISRKCGLFSRCLHMLKPFKSPTAQTHTHRLEIFLAMVCFVDCSEKQTTRNKYPCTSLFACSTSTLYVCRMVRATYETRNDFIYHPVTERLQIDEELFKTLHNQTK